MGQKIKGWHNPEKRPREFFIQDERKGKAGYRNKRERQERESKRVDYRKFTPDFWYQ